MKRPLQVGDRVRVYCTHDHWDGVVSRIQNVTFKHDKPTVEMVFVKQPNGVEYRQHPKQVRRLKPRPAKQPESPRVERLECYAVKKMGCIKQLQWSYPLAGEILAHRFVELREGESICPRGSIPLSRADLEKAWDACDFANRKATNGAEMFERFCAALNLPKEETK